MISNETLHRPGILGRGVRLAMGIALLVLGIETLLAPTDWISASAPRTPAMWLGAAICFHLLWGVPDKGFQRAWGRWPQLITICLAILAIAYNLVRTGSWWGQPLGALVFVLIVYVTAHLGLSFVVASFLAHPG
ncbi:MAG: hypothetical protein O7G88_12550 [bacterium]|nr:hypothetical protein [bacterium]